MDQFKQLYQKYQEDIYKYLFYLAGDPHIAEDLTQETFIGAFQSIQRFKGNSKVSTWLYQIAKYTFYSYLRKKEKNKEVIDSYNDHDQLIGLDTPELIYNEKEKSMLVLNALKQLKQPQQHIVILRIYNELSFKEIGEIFDQSDVWARVNFYRGKNALALIIERGDKE